MVILRITQFVFHPSWQGHKDLNFQAKCYLVLNCPVLYRFLVFSELFNALFYPLVLPFVMLIREKIRENFFIYNAA